VSKRKHDVVRNGWSANKLADEASHQIDTKEKLKQGEVARNTEETTLNNASSETITGALSKTHSDH
jgi:hypothetical protein